MSRGPLCPQGTPGGVTELFGPSPLSWRGGSEGTVSPLSLSLPGAGMCAGNGPIPEKSSSLGRTAGNSLTSCLGWSTGPVGFPPFPLSRLPSPCLAGILGTLSSL